MTILKKSFFILILFAITNTECMAFEWEISPAFQTSSQFCEGMANISQYTMFVNKNGELVYQFPDNAPRFSQEFSEGISVGTNARTGSSNTHMLMDKQGVISEISGFSQINNFSQGLAVVSNEDKTKYGYINKSFDIAIPLIYNYAENFSEGFAPVRNGSGWNYIDKNGDIAINGNFKRAKSFCDGLAAVKNSDGLWGYIDYTGNYVIEPKFLSADNFSCDVAVVMTDEGWNIVNKNGSTLTVPNDIEIINTFYNDVAVIYKNNKYGLMNKNCTVLSDCEWEYLSDCHEGVITGKKDGVCYILNSKNEIIDITECTEIESCSENLINAKDANGLWGYIKNPIALPSPWSEKIIDEMFNAGLITDELSYNYQDNISRIEFCSSLVYAIERKTNTTLPVTVRVAFTDTSNINISKLVSAGIIDGVSKTKFAPDDYLTREQAAKIFMYLGNKYGILKNVPSETKFIDNEDISDWAYESVYTMQSNGIMQGYENGEFQPYTYLTKEQAIAMIYRFLNKFKI